MTQPTSWECTLSIAQWRAKVPGTKTRNGLLGSRLLLAAQEANAAVEGAVRLSEKGEERRGVHVVVHHVGIRTVGNVVQTDARGPQITLEMGLSFDRRIQSEEFGEAVRRGAGNKLAKLVHGDKGESRVIDRRRRKIKFLEFPDGRQWVSAPGGNLIGSVPGKRSAYLRTGREVVQRKIKGFVGAGFRASVRK